MRIKTILLTALGFLFLGMGGIGLLLPVWPTTPFVLISFACFSGTPTLRARIMKIGFFKEHIENYKLRTGLSRKTVMISLAYLWGMLLLSICFVQSLYLLFLMVCIGMAVTIHILCMSRSKE